jgi:dTDP-4-dehydrorhamnose reductase
VNSLRLLVFGAGGQVGQALIEAAENSRCVAFGLTHAEVDICDKLAVTEAIRNYAPTILVNAAAYTAVDKAESEPGQAFHVNREGARVVAELAVASKIPVIHLSTDYVFGGQSEVPYTETDKVAPLGIYGRSKEEGERAIRELATKHIILRTAWLFSPFGTNFVRTMLRLGSERAEIQVVDDQIGCPTAAGDAAAAIIAIARATESTSFDDWGTYHYAGDTVVTWYRFAQLIFEEAVTLGFKAPTLKPISTAQCQRPASRPAYSVLSSDKLRRIFAIRPQPLHDGLSVCLKKLLKGNT